MSIFTKVIGIVGRTLPISGMLGYFLIAMAGAYIGYIVSEHFYTKNLNSMLKQEKTHLSNMLDQERRHREFLREYGKEREEAAYQSAQIIIDELEGHISALEVKTNTVTKEIIKYVPQGDTECNLRRGTVSLLNDAIRTANHYRGDGRSETTAISLAEKQTYSTVTQQAIIEDYIKLINQYGELAGKHDALIDWIKRNYPGLTTTTRTAREQGESP